MTLPVPGADRKGSHPQYVTRELDGLASDDGNFYLAT